MLGYLVAAIIAIVIAMQVVPLIRARSARGQAVPGLDAVLDETQRSEKRLLVYFWSPSCGMCRPMSSVIDRIAAESNAVVRVNVAESMALARQFGVMGTPSLALVENGIVQELLVGARTESQIRALLSP